MLTAERILIIKPSSLGDVVHALPVLGVLRRAFPEAHIAWLVNTSLAPLLEDHPLLDELIRFDRNRFGRMWRDPRIFFEFGRFAAGIRRRRFDLVIDLQGLIRSGLLCLFSGAAQRVGFGAAREGAWLFYSQRICCPGVAEHAVEKNLALVQALGLSTDRPEFPLGLRTAEREQAAELLAQAAGERLASFTAVIPGARWPSKLWPAQNFATLIDRMHAEGMARCVLLGAPDERDFAQRVRAGCQSDVVDLVGRTSLRQLAALIDLAQRVVCHDSGPLHIAAALGKPTVALFGPTNPARTGPYSDAARVVAHPVDCAPCYRRVCPFGHQDCLRRLAVETVLAEVRSLGGAAAPRADAAAYDP